MTFSDINRFIRLSHLLFQSKYADSSLGILWIPLSNLFLIGVLVAIFGSQNPDDLWFYVGYISVGYITWSFVSDTINNHCDTFRTKRNELYAPNTTLSEIFIKALVERVYLLCMNLVCLSFLFFGQVVENPMQLLFFPLALILVLLQSYYTSVLFSISTLFFPDFKRYLANLTRVLFFASPIFWGFRGELGGARFYFFSYNPVTYFLETFRFSLGGEIRMEITYVLTVTCSMVIVTMILANAAMAILPKYARNIQ